MTVSLIVAMSENDVIGRGGEMPWHLSADLKRFKRITMGHHIVMGRRTFESIGRILPGRTTIVLTTNTDFKADGALIVSSFVEALELAKSDNEVFVVGGGEIYRLALPVVSKVYLTRVHTIVDDGDTTFPALQWDSWELIQSETGQADEKNDFDYTFETYERRNKRPANQTYASTDRKYRAG